MSKKKQMSSKPIITGAVGGNLFITRFWCTIKARSPLNLYLERRGASQRSYPQQD